MIEQDPASQEVDTKENVMEKLTQDPKYIIIDGQLANAATREFIPEDEPIFIMRAKDSRAAEAIRCYGESCVDEAHQSVVADREMDFIGFAEEYPERMGEPDTACAEDWPDDKGEGTDDDSVPSVETNDDIPPY